ncbi:pilus assembly protein PilP [Xylophilus ampelinus]|uniref:Type IV pilus assembly protein PilP n=1 Tax=Xylophilus ampelinus TaxID=54067 RepID=A0A318SMX9_9BURK|nr:pilus assembly protein PilP [Xylophilus ampelinus]MCS4510104.1 pilus assembly protein PilP [Xylophilus ampelinus]PYE78253.1 type IV pilus assembly protein PilP [Xylophilus ampelinus]
MMRNFGWLAVCTALLGGCAGSGQEEIQAWMNEQKVQTRPRITPLTEPKQFTPQDYTQQNTVDPFNVEKLTQALRRDSSRSTANETLITPEMQRRKEPLEAFPLDAMAMVGSMVKAGQPVGLVRANNLLYQVRAGEYLGQNFGRVLKITETEITLREIVPDATGDWVERVTSLQLQERSK